AFEARSGVAVRDTDGKGGFVPTTSGRDPHLVVVYVSPNTDLANSVLGFDIASDPVRRDAAKAAKSARAPVLSNAIALASSGRPGVFVVEPVFEGDQVLGYISSGVSVDDLVAAATIQLRPHTALSLLLDGRHLVGTGNSGGRATFASGG